VHDIKGVVVQPFHNASHNQASVLTRFSYRRHITNDNTVLSSKHTSNKLSKMKTTTSTAGQPNARYINVTIRLLTARTNFPQLVAASRHN